VHACSRKVKAPTAVACGTETADSNKKAQAMEDEADIVVPFAATTVSG
jgi:hypothetical protein